MVCLAALVYIGSHDFYIHLFCFFDIFGAFGKIFGYRRDKGGEVFARIMDFQICRSVRYICVSRRMAFVEGVFCKRCHRFEDLFRVLFRKSVRDSTGAYFVAIFVFFTENKGIVLLFHLSAFLFRHGAADDICASERKSRKFAAYAHDLFLIYNAAGSGGEDIF